MKSLIFFLSLLLLLTGCRTAKPVVSPAPERGGSEKLFANKWSLREVEGLTLMPTTEGREAYLLFFPGQISTVSGSTGCNSLKGTFELTGEHKIRFSPLATTKKMCLPDGNNTEQRFLSALGKADNYIVTDASLTLLNGTVVVSRLAATPAETSTVK